MAAIKPHLEQPDETSPAERAHDAKPRGRGKPTLTAAEVVHKNHAGLVQLLWTRQMVEQALYGRNVTLGFDGDFAFLAVDPPLPPGVPAWNAIAPSGRARARFLSWTSKMGAPSWSLPAGALSMGGACPGAGAAQTVVPQGDAHVRASKHVILHVLGEHVRVEDAVCERCLTGDARVHVRDRGLVRLDELVPGELIEVWSGQAWRRTTVIEQGVRAVARLTTSWGLEITATPDHKVLTDEGMRALEDLEPGDRLVATPPEAAPFPTHAPIDFATQDRHFNAVGESYPTAWSYDVGLLLGWVLGDGTIARGKYPTISVATGVEDRDAIDRLQRVVATWCGTEAQVREIESTPGAHSSCVRAVAPAKMARVAWRVRSLYAFVTHLGLDKYTAPEGRRAPESLWTASADGVRGFLAGLFGADGSVGVQPKSVEVSLAAVSRPLLQDVQLLLQALGVRATICTYGSAWREEAGYHTLYKLTIHAREHVTRFAEAVGFGCARKQSRLTEALAKLLPMLKPRNSYPHVVAVEHLAAPELVYDLVNVGEEHQFVAGGLVVSNCYATGGNYIYASNQMAQLLRLHWQKHAITTGTFVPTMIDVISRANFEINGRTGRPSAAERTEGVEGAVKIHPEPARFRSHRFFRIHDSGDFQNIHALQAWKAVADALPDVVFWAPTRIWATPWGIDAVNRVNGDRRNLIIRPSAYHVNEHAPDGRTLGPGWAAGTVVYHKSRKHEGTADYDWDCQTYATTQKNHTCRVATPPGGAKDSGCRACWLHPELRINYTEH